MCRRTSIKSHSSSHAKYPKPTWVFHSRPCFPTGSCLSCLESQYEWLKLRQPQMWPDSVHRAPACLPYDITPTMEREPEEGWISGTDKVRGILVVYMDLNWLWTSDGTRLSVNRSIPQTNWCCSCAFGLRWLVSMRSSSLNRELTCIAVNSRWKVGRQRVYRRGPFFLTFYHRPNHESTECSAYPRNELNWSKIQRSEMYISIQRKFTYGRRKESGICDEILCINRRRRSASCSSIPVPFLVRIVRSPFKRVCWAIWFQSSSYPGPDVTARRINRNGVDLENNIRSRASTYFPLYYVFDTTDMHT